MKTTRITGCLIIRNGTDVRWLQRRPALAPNEVAVAINITVPQPPRTIAVVDITLPEPPPVEASLIETEYIGESA